MIGLGLSIPEVAVRSGSWILAPGGILPSHDIDFANGRAWVNGVGFVTPASLITFNGSPGGGSAVINNTGLQIGATDVATLTTPPSFGSAYSMVAWATPSEPLAFATNQELAQIDDGSNNNRLILDRVASTGLAQFVSISGGTGMTGGATAWAQNALGKLGVSDTASSQIGVFNGGVPFTKAGALPVGVNTVRIGSNTVGASQWNGAIRRLLIWPTTALSAAALQQVTR